jgi:hypothetical protein
MRRNFSFVLAVVTAGTLVSAVMSAPIGAQQRGLSQQQPAAASNQPAKVDVDDLVKNGDKYVGKTVTIEGEATEVLGPHLFAVDEPKWFHLHGGMIVVVPEPLAAIVRRDAPVRVTGTVEKVVLAEARRKWSFLSDPKVEVDLFEKPVLVAKEVTTVAPAIVSLIVGPDQPVGTSGSTGAPITDLNQVASATDSSLVGRRVEATGTVARTEANGFWVRTSSGNEVQVIPATKANVREGQTVTIRGTVLETPRRDKNSGGKSHAIYVYADQVAPK